MKYDSYEIRDFACDDSFIRWVMEGSPEDSRFWEDYQRNNPAQRDKIVQARELLINLRKAEQTLHKPERVTKMWRHIEGGMFENIESRPARSIRSFPLYKIAACLAILCLMIVSWYALRPPVVSKGPSGGLARTTEERGFVEKVNTTGAVMRIALSDGSTVDLHDRSRLWYREDHSAHTYREVFLTGEAYFQIAKDSKRPFLVYANEVVTRVLGTSFRVRAFEADREILVAVKEGKVSVYSARGKNNINHDSIVAEVNGVVLTPNQQVVYARADDSFVRTLIPGPEIIDDAAVKSLFIFEDAPVTEVFKVLERSYGVEIIVDEEVMRNCYLTVRLQEESLFEKLKIICRTIGAKYELIDAKIIVDGNGC